MGRAFAKLAVSPLRRRFDAARTLPAVNQMVAAERPHEPVHCLRPRTIAAAARHFVAAFPGDVLYAVKCNPDPRVLRALWAGGIRQFDCASLAEVALVRQMFPAAAIHFMHPVKSRAAIAESWRRHGVRTFVIDSAAELAKLGDELPGSAAADGLAIVVRLAVTTKGAVYDLSGKFGAAPGEAVALLRAAHGRAARLGLSFHVGSQMLQPEAYTAALAQAAAVIERAQVPVAIIDVGGGFPAAYEGTTLPPLSAFMAAINAGLTAFPAAPAVRLWAEPGRALVAGGASVVVQVQLRRGSDLYINDGVYGSLSDAGTPGFRFPARRIELGRSSAAGALVPFRLFGPTCDSADRMDGPFLLPADVAEGDWIEIGQLGAYGSALRTAFNGFDRARLVEVSDPPLLPADASPALNSDWTRPRRVAAS
jgi:ornithine decarboxylase